jgi:predicted SAM-dependent methyltransferase
MRLSPSRFFSFMKKLIQKMHLDVAAVALKHQIRFRLRKLLGKDRKIIGDYLTGNPSPKLQLACGSNHPIGWLNTDYYHPSDTTACLDVTERFPFADHTFTAILAEHVIEHFTYLDGKAMMAECFRTLKPGGILRLSTPNIRFYTGLFEPENMEKLKESYVIPHQKAWVPFADEARATFVLNNLVRNWRHLFVYDFETVAALLKSVGFTDISLKEIGESDHPDLIGVDRLFRDAGDFERLSNMVLEAAKPAR